MQNLKKGKQQPFSIVRAISHDRKIVLVVQVFKARCLVVQTLRLNKVGKSEISFVGNDKRNYTESFWQRGAGKMPFFKKKSYLQSNFSTKPLVSGAVHV
ncbi:MAG: hypothetical protein E7042_06470 [Lentisphaerae bacterium]|nr:hypothetical protein [Lentisphaerota bacterium]